MSTRMYEGKLNPREEGGVYLKGQNFDLISAEPTPTGGSQRKIAANVATLDLASLRDGKADSRQGEYDRGQGTSVHRALQFDVNTVE
jgi:hypothetical protein